MALPDPEGPLFRPTRRQPALVLQLMAPVLPGEPIEDSGALDEIDAAALLADVQAGLTDLPAGLTATAAIATSPIGPVRDLDGTEVNRSATTLGVWVPALAEGSRTDNILEAIDLVGPEDASLFLVTHLKVDIRRGGMATMVGALAGSLSVGRFKTTSTAVRIDPDAGTVTTEVRVERTRRRSEETTAPRFTLAWVDTPAVNEALDVCPPLPPVLATTERRFDGLLNTFASGAPRLGALAQLLLLLPLPVRQAIVLPSGELLRAKTLTFEYANPQLDTNHVFLSARAELSDRGEACAHIRERGATLPAALEGQGPLELYQTLPPPAFVVVDLEAVVINLRAPVLLWEISGAVTATFTASRISIAVPTDPLLPFGTAIVHVKLTATDVDQGVIPVPPPQIAERTIEVIVPPHLPPPVVF